MSKIKKGYKGAGISKISVGYDKMLEVLKLEDEVATLWYPPYNIRKTSASEYAIDVEISGYEKSEISARIEDGALIITGPAKNPFADPEGDDVYYHQGIFPGGELYAKFYIADTVELDSATYDDGIITFKFLVKAVSEKSLMVPIGPFETEKAATKPFEPVYNSLGEVIAGIEAAKEVPVYEPEVRDEVVVVVNDDTNRKPTVEVIALDPMPQIVEIAVENVVAEVDKKSEEPQATIVLKDATYEVIPNNVYTEVIKTEAGQSDIVVAIPVEVHDELKDAGIDPVQAIEKALEVSEIKSPELPAEAVSAPAEVSTSVIEVAPTASDSINTPVEVVVPEVLPSVIEAKVEDGQVVLHTDVSENIPAAADVVPVVTAPGQPDVAVVITPSTAEHLEELGIDPAKDLSTAIVESGATVEPSPVVAGPVFDTVDTPIVLNGESTEKPTVEVILPDPLPQIVEVTVESVAETIDLTSEEPQVVIKVEEAVHEVSDNVVTEVIKTEEGKSDIVVAITEEDAAKLAVVDVNVIEAVTEAIAQSELVAPELPVVTETPTVSTEVTTPVAVVEVVAPEIIPQVVEATVVELPVAYNSAGSPVETVPQVVLTDVSGDIPADATLIPVVTAKGEHDVMVAVTPETEVKLEELKVDVAEVVGEALVDAKTEVVVAEPTAPVVEEATPMIFEPVAEPIILNAEVTDTPTVEVVLPEVLPQVVEVTVENVAPVVDNASTEPQATIVVSDATYEVKADDVVTEVVKTPEGQSDVVVAVSTEVKEELAAVGIDAVEAVKAAIEEAAPAAPELPAPEELITAENVTVSVTNEATDTSKLEVTTPDTISQVVEAVMVETVSGEGVAVELVNVAENIPEGATLVPVVTMEGQPDVVVAVTEETKVALEAANVNISEDVSKALVEAEVKVVTVEEVVIPVATEEPVAPETPAQ